jgi:hypothetical protein
VRQPRVARRVQAARIEPHDRLRLLERAASELLESETNASLVLGVRGVNCDPVVVTALGCSVLVAVGLRGAVLVALSSPGRRGGAGPRALAEGCDRTLRRVHGLPARFVPTVTFDHPVNAARFLGAGVQPGHEGR